MSAPSGARRSCPPKRLQRARPDTAARPARCRATTEAGRPRVSARGAGPILGQKPFQRHDEEGAKPAFFPGGGLQVVLLQEPGEELLGKVLGIGRAVPLPTHVGIEGIPISAAESFQRGSRLRRILPARRQHHRPMRRHEDRPALTNLRSRRGWWMSRGWLGSAHAGQSRGSEAKGKGLELSTVEWTTSCYCRHGGGGSNSVPPRWRTGEDREVHQWDSMGIP